MELLNSIEHVASIKIINKLKFIKILIKVNNLTINISAIYRSHDISKKRFNELIETFLNQNIVMSIIISLWVIST